MYSIVHLYVQMFEVSKIFFKSEVKLLEKYIIVKFFFSFSFLLISHPSDNN